MKLASSELTIIPKIYKNKNWCYLGEKIYVESIWIKMNYYDVFIVLDKFSNITLTDHINMTLSLKYDLIA